MKMSFETHFEEVYGKASVLTIEKRAIEERLGVAIVPPAVRATVLLTEVTIQRYIICALMGFSSPLFQFSCATRNKQESCEGTTVLLGRRYASTFGNSSAAINHLLEKYAKAAGELEFCRIYLRRISLRRSGNTEKEWPQRERGNQNDTGEGEKIDMLRQPSQTMKGFASALQSEVRRLEKAILEREYLLTRKTEKKENNYINIERKRAENTTAGEVAADRKNWECTLASLEHDLHGVLGDIEYLYHLCREIYVEGR
tara:strand:+ start:2235 stop:3005 length:771 start_codon:yes stop_codon:yes gene_type:complete